MDKLELLVVDDNSTSREALRGQLEHWGAAVQEAVDGPSALTLLEERAQDGLPLFDVAFLDSQMLEMNGAELGKQIKADDRFASMKLVMMTSLSHRGDAWFFADLGFSGYFPKPATTSDLFKALAVVADGGEVLSGASPLVTRHYLKSLEHDDPSGSQQRNMTAYNWPANVRLLLVEDNHINQEVALGILEDLGLGADIASNGLEAIQALSDSLHDNPYTLVLMDCQMPELDGYEASRNIRSGRAGERYQSIPIVAMTANAMAGDRVKCLDAGMSDYLTKPIAPDLLFSALHKWLSGEESQEPCLQAATRSRQAEQAEQAELVVWDEDALLRRIRGKEKLLKLLINSFLLEMPGHMDELQQAADAANGDQVRLQAHTIKGVAGNLGGLVLQQCAAQMEGAAKDRDAKQIACLMPGLQSAYREIKRCFEQRQGEQTDGDSNQSPLLDEQQLSSLVQSLASRLQQSEYIDTAELAPLFQSYTGPEQLARLDHLSEQITQFDVEGAMRTLNEIVAITAEPERGEEEIS